MIQIATRFPVRPIRTAATLCVWVVSGWTAQSPGSDELEGTLGKGTESLLLGDGRAPPISWHRPAGWYRADDGRTSQETLDSAQST